MLFHYVESYPTWVDMLGGKAIHPVLVHHIMVYDS